MRRLPIVNSGPDSRNPAPLVAVGSPAAPRDPRPRRAHRRGMASAGLVALAALLAVPAAAADPASGAMLGDTCAACHGTHGRVFDEAMPPLAGMDPRQFIRAMEDFKSGARPAVIMDRVARGYDPAEVRAMAEYFAAQPAEPWRSAP